MTIRRFGYKNNVKNKLFYKNNVYPKNVMLLQHYQEAQTVKPVSHALRIKKFVHQTKEANYAC